MDKRVLRKEAVPNRKLNLRSGIFCAEQIEYVVCTAIKNIAHRRTLVLHVYEKKRCLPGIILPGGQCSRLTEITSHYVTKKAKQNGALVCFKISVQLGIFHTNAPFIL